MLLDCAITDINIKNKRGKSALDLARFYNDQEAINLLTAKQENK